jgi:hypothetical protein
MILNAVPPPHTLAHLSAGASGAIMGLGFLG